ncbi:unnamed protein product [Xylocopa violacea]|uniref:Chromatin modification-related protein YNG2 n=1 Tax=Xylocopa violacea TaxID=135666 RepID=A0ABP1P4L5_XYLVO
MEDEDGESKVVDMWSILGKEQLKDTSIGNSLKPSIDNTYSDVIEEEKQLLQYNSITTKDSASKNNSTGSKIVFKGFKKRILAQTQETNALKNVVQEQQLPHSNVPSKNSKEKRAEIKRGKITEYAQYLGLQPSSKNKCSKCQPSSNLCSTLKQSSCACNSAMTPMPSTSESSTVSHSPNFKITRKVYLCAACGTYFENWNLFLHMRDIHKRHICLFCLGMFGQAERLSHHLTKKHSVPEMAFASVEDFYGAFKGSCYLVCCTCEKVFSETDNFYNHFCSSTSKQDCTASICTLCRQTGTHASTCSLAVEMNKELSSAVSPTTQTGVISTKVLDKGINKTVPRKPVRNNRSKHMEDGVSDQQKVNVHTKKTNNKVTASQLNESQVFDETLNRDENSQNVVTHNTVKDTVSETIMEVSKYIEDSCEEKEGTSEKEMCQTPAELNSTRDTDTPSHSMPYDSITETIMEVSQCTNNIEDFDDTSKKEDIGVVDASSTSDKLEVTLNEMAKSDTETLSITEENIRRDDLNSVSKESEGNIAKEKTETETTLEANDSHSNVSESPAHSPISRSLFSPQHESNVSDLQSKENTHENENKENLDVPNESQPSVSFNTSETSDRSLVIKICTNRNSQFSVATNSDNVENDVSKKPEKNNNAESSVTDEKESNIFERERDNSNNYQVNEEDSDSDSFKLAVVDSVAEETEEVEETNESKTVTEVETESNTNIENNENQIEVTDEKTIDIDTNGKQDEETKDDTQSHMESAAQSQMQPSDGIVLAGEDVPCIDLNVNDILDSIEIEDLLKRCIEAASPFCVYCNHARHIAVNGKQLGLHMLAEHKFQPQHPAIIIQAEQFITRVKKSLDELDFHFFNLDSYSSSNGTYNVPNVRTYECFHCRFHSAIHKELYLHNRKMHQKTILICIMCKSTFYSYSELLCHLCPGIYSPNINVKYRCCLCPMANLPSAFRLMVHLRKRHHACDVCLESTGNQQRLSNHVWKHKLHHLCYRCGIAYRNKPDITKHLFWKHGTESVLCKKCLQKKWPHIYHFCIPPTAFGCEECGSSFSRAVGLKVHKRLHSGDHPYACSECSERFISRKLLAKHENAHKEPPPVSANLSDTTSQQPVIDEEKLDKDIGAVTDSNAATFETSKETKEPVKKVVDVYDLPPLNLSSESDTDPEEEKPEAKEPESIKDVKPMEDNATSPTDQSKVVSSEPVTDSIVEVEQNEEEQEQGAQIMDGIWDNFKTYTASLEMKESGNSFAIKEPEPETDVAFLRSIVLADHDYCVVWSDKDKDKEAESKTNDKEEANTSGDQDYLNKPQKSPLDGNGVQTTVNEDDANKKKVKSPKKKKQGGSTSSSDSSSDSDSSSCSCGTNCSCSSSSSGSSSSSSSSSDSDSSTSDGSPKKQANRKERKKDKESTQEPETGYTGLENKEITPDMENGAATVSAEPVCPPQLLLRESDLETEETETDEDFYDEHPQQLANKLLAEKRNQLMLLAAVAPASTESTVPLNNGLTDTDTAVPSPDPIPAPTEEEQSQQKRKVKIKKRKKGERTKQRNVTSTMESIKLNIPKAFYQKNPGYSASLPAHTNVALMPSANDVHAMNTAAESQAIGVAGQNIGGSGSEAENKRSSKRKRVPKRFYGDSSDDEVEKQPTAKWRKVETPSFTTAPTTKPLPPRLPFGGKSVAYRAMESQSENVGIAAASATESEELADSSSDSSDTEIEASQQVQTHLPESNAPAPERPVNLYCYCQCPYDEVSEMIACDAEDCRIEWFHFECVGIMVPPKGKWYCPDCRKKHGILQNSEDYFD